MSFPTNMQRLRADRNLTQERLTMLLGVSRQSIGKWESGKAYPELDKRTAICDLFGCTLDDLVMGDVSAAKPWARGGSAAPDAKPRADVVTEPAGGPSATRAADRARSARRTAFGIVCGIGLILSGAAEMVWADEVRGVSDGWPVSLLFVLVAAGAGAIVHVGIRKALMDIDDYNRRAEIEREGRAAERDVRDRVGDGLFEAAMLIATAVGLVLLFNGCGLFWLAWPIGALVGGAASTLVGIFRRP